MNNDPYPKRKIICAPDSFKGSLSSVNACEAMVRGLLRLGIKEKDILRLPIADGGEGTSEAFLAFTEGGEKKYVTVTDSFGDEKEVFYAWFPDKKTAVIEMAAASGLTSRLDPLYTTSFGTGMLVKAAIENGAENIILGIGGTGTTDCGIGAAAALGAQFLDADGAEIPLCGKGLVSLAEIKTDKLKELVGGCTFTVLCDVNNPLYGENGAAYVYGPQKGATGDDIILLDEGLRNFAAVVSRDTGKDIAGIPGAGAAGGMGAGAIVFLDAVLRSGIKTVLEISGFSSLLDGVGLIITGEGRFDRQSLSGKVYRGISESARGIPVGILCGKAELSREDVPELAFLGEISPAGTPFETSVANAAAFLEEATVKYAGDFLSGVHR